MIQQLYEPFRSTWSGKGTVWILSDPHFNDTELIAGAPNHPDATTLIKNINSKVGSNDTLILLGDICDCECIKQIRPKAHKVLIMGNHDDKGVSYYKQYFDEVYEGALTISKNVILSHEPLIAYPFLFNIHGHEHHKHSMAANELNVCVDALDESFPVSLTALYKKGGFSSLPVKDIHRYTIDRATARSRKRN